MHTLPLSPRYLLCKYVPLNTGKIDKIPLNPYTLQAHNPLDTSIHMSYDSVKNLISLQENPGLFGIGFVFLEEDRYFFIDIDNCLLEDNKNWSHLALDSVTLFNAAYIEVSKSGRGLHIIGRYEGDRPIHSCKRTDLGIEIYTGDRFCALAEIHPNGNAESIHTHTLLDYINRLGMDKVEELQFTEWTTESDPKYTVPEDNQELINHILNKPHTEHEAFGNVVHIKDLWENNVDVLTRAYPSSIAGKPYDYSSADSALAHRLHYFTGWNCERVKELMFLSKLRRDKWDREDYLPRTIINARGSRSDAYTYHGCRMDNTATTNQNQQNLNTTPFVDILRMSQEFQGCVYILKEHRILLPGGVLVKPDQFRSKFGGVSWPMDSQSVKMTRNAWEAFNESQVFKKPQVEESRFNPLIAPGSIYLEDDRFVVNIYWPQITPRVKLPVEKFINHIRLLLPDQRDQLILISFMAAVVQYKGIKFSWCVIIQGVEGNGKSFLSEALSFCIGHKYVHNAKSSELTGKFNGWMQNSLLVTVDDIYQNDIEMLETLKPMITNKRQEIERKGMDKTTETIYCNFILNTNHKDGIRKSRDDRRFCTLFTAQQEVQDLVSSRMDGNYFPELFHWFNKEQGNAAINEFLSTFQIPDEFNPATCCIRAPITSTTHEAISHGLHPLADKINEWIEEGHQGFRNGWVSSMAINRMLDSRYKVNPKIFSKILNSLGYYKHEVLLDGRASRFILLDNGKPRLYVKKDHPSLKLNSSEEVLKNYENDNK